MQEEITRPDAIPEKEWRAMSDATKRTVAGLHAKATAKRTLRPTFKVGNKGGISVGGLGQRFPTTLYKDSWLALLDHADELRAFIKANEHRLAKGKGEEDE